MKEELEKQFEKTRRLIQPSEACARTLSEFYNLIEMFYKYLESKKPPNDPAT